MSLFAAVDPEFRSVSGRPVSGVTADFLAWVCQRLAAEGKQASLLVWDNASYHVSQRVRLVACWLPINAPWLDRIEAEWVRGKRAIIEPDRKRSGEEVIERVCEHYGCEKLDRLEQEVRCFCTRPPAWPSSPPRRSGSQTWRSGSTRTPRSRSRF